MQIRSDARVAVFGKTGSGKTVYVKSVLYPNYQKKIFHDIKGENNEIYHTAKCTNPLELTEALTKGHLAILYQPSDISTSDFNKVCQIVFNQGNIALFIDETAAICSTSSIEYWHNQILIRGRSRGIGIIHCSQRPRAIHNTTISESEHFFIFKLLLPTDRDKLKQALTNDIIEQVGTLPPYHCIYANLNEECYILPPVKI